MPAQLLPRPQSLRVVWSWRSPRISTPALIAAGFAAYAVALVATLPARLAGLPGDAAGTVWHGAAALPGGVSAEWNWSLTRSLAVAGPGFDWTLDGADTALRGVARLGPGGPAIVDAHGRVAWPVVAAAVPALPAGCAIALDVALDRAGGGVTGTVNSAAGTCPGPGGAVRAIPRMIASFAGGIGRVAPWSDRATTLATIDLSGTVTRLHLTPAGGATLLGRSGEVDASF